VILAAVAIPVLPRWFIFRTPDRGQPLGVMPSGSNQSFTVCRISGDDINSRYAQFASLMTAYGQGYPPWYCAKYR